MICGSAGYYMDFLDGKKLRITHSQLFYHNIISLDSGAEGIRNRFGLLIHFLQHKMLIAGLFRGFRIPVNGHRLLLHFFLIHVVNMKAVGSQADDFLVFNIGHGSCVFQDCRDIGSDEAAFSVLPDDEGAVFSYRKQLPGKISEQDSQGVGAFHTVKDLGNGYHGILIIVIIQHMGEHFRIRFRNKLIPSALQLLFQREIILYNSVMYNGNSTLRIKMGMGIHIAGRSMSCPPGMADSKHSRHSCSVMCQFLQNLQSSHGFGDIDFLTIKNCHSRRIISTIFQLGKSVQDDRCRLIFTDVAYYSTHTYLRSSSISGYSPGHT